MRKLLGKGCETVASIAIVVLFAGVAMFFNGSRLAYFGHHSVNHLANIETIPASLPVYAENVWQGKHVWKPVDFGPEGTLSVKDFVGQMYEKTFPQQDSGFRIQDSGRKAGAAGMREGQSNLPHWVHVVARHADGTVFLDEWGHNLRTNAGINWQYGQMAGTPAAVCSYIA